MSNRVEKLNRKAEGNQTHRERERERESGRQCVHEKNERERKRVGLTHTGRGRKTPS